MEQIGKAGMGIGDERWVLGRDADEFQLHSDAHWQAQSTRTGQACNHSTRRNCSHAQTRLNLSSSRDLFGASSPGGKILRASPQPITECPPSI